MATKKHVDMLKQGIVVWNAWREKHLDEEIDLSEANLSRTNLYKANLSDTDLRDTNLREARLIRAYLYKANLSGVDLRSTNLNEADLSSANLIRADLSDADLRSTNLSKAFIGRTIFGKLDLRTVKGLETINHQRPSEISISTLEKSNGEIPDLFLKGIGASDPFITYTRSLIQSPIQYYSCFISYSSVDQEFAERLYADLQQRGIRCWFAPHSLKIGDHFNLTSFA